MSRENAYENLIDCLGKRHHPRGRGLRESHAGEEEAREEDDLRAGLGTARAQLDGRERHGQDQVGWNR